MTSKTRSGKTLILNCHWSLMRHANGQPKAFLVVGTDVTEKKQVEAQFLRAQRLESLGALASGIAHDLNNVLAPIMMSLTILRSQQTSESQDRLFDVLETSAKRGADIVKQVLTFARGAQGQRVSLQAKHLAREIVGVLRDTLPKNIRVATELPKELAMVVGDSTQLHQVLMNLCVNARDAMPQGGTLTLSAKHVVIDESLAAMMPGARPGPYVVLTVSDTGTGIPPETLDRIFEPFFTTKEQGKGTGLGLSTVLGIVRSHGGFVQAKSEVNRGSQFIIYLPASAEGKATDTAVELRPVPTGQGELILVVDDEESIREIVKAALEQHGYRVLTASDGTQAVVLLAQERENVRAVVCDMSMPNMDGPATIGALWKLEPELPIIGATGNTSQVGEERIRRLNLKVLLMKPFAARELLVTLDQMLHPKPLV